MCLKSSLKFLLGFAVGVCIIAKLPICYSVSNSLPYKIFYMTGDTDIKPNDYVIFKHHLHPKMIKQVAGVSSDRIAFREDGALMVTSSVGEIEVGQTKAVDRRGNAVTKILPATIPSGYFFARGTNAYSMDSRYQEFGLVPIDSIISRAVPLW